jgi:putative endonuclease
MAATCGSRSLVGVGIAASIEKRAVTLRLPGDQVLVHDTPRMGSKTYAVYILASASGVLYTGVTNNVVARTIQHKQKRIAGFTRTYNVNRLVYFEVFGEITEAIDREKQIKRWTRAKKIRLIESQNPQWLDLSLRWPR